MSKSEGKVFDGKGLAQEIEERVKSRVASLNNKGVFPKLVSVLVGEDRASHLYVDLKGEAAKRVGIQFKKIEFKVKSEKLKVEEIINIINKLNGDDLITGIMVQMPLPEDIRDRTWEVVGAIDPKKDVDCLTAENLGRVLVGKERFLPATVKAVLDILVVVRSDLAGKRVVIVGRSAIVGRPLTAAMVNRDAVVTVAHSKIENLAEVTREAEILISATGKAGLIKKDMVRPGAVVIDVGEPKGDVAEEVRQVVSLVTPVPGGVGPVTVASLLENVVQVYSSR